MWEQECCYSVSFSSWGALLVGPPHGGSANVLKAHFKKKFMEHYSNNIKPFSDCCVKSSNSLNCMLYYERRPTNDCTNYVPPTRSWTWGDPHIVTLDGMNYTFNGIGEYTLLNVNNSFFKLQARTRRAVGAGTATIFSACAIQEHNSSKVQIDLNDEAQLDALIDGEKIDPLSITSENITYYAGVQLYRPYNSTAEAIIVSFSSGLSVTVTAVIDMLSIIFQGSEKFKNSTKGLLGTWNGNPDDDFMTPNGTFISPLSTSREIHYNFGLKWQISSNDSLFTYNPGESFHTYQNTSYEPLFVDELDSGWANDSLRQQAERLCNGDVSCLFDTAATRDLSVGAASMNTSLVLEKELKELENFPPEIFGPSTINVILNQTAEVIINAKDANNDSLSFSVINKPTGTIIHQYEHTLILKWDVKSHNEVAVEVAVSDNSGASSVYRPVLLMCACEHGICINKTSLESVRFTLQDCLCDEGYTGRRCQYDLDACAENSNPCYPGVNCTDLPAPANITGYTCGSCPTGMVGNGETCTDFDECALNSTLCAQTCVNVPGSFICDCFDGYILNSDGRNCDDINECEPSSDCMQICENYPGGYNCSCRQYFTIDPNNTKTCIPDSSCNNTACEHICYEMNNGTTLCACHKGYYLESNGLNCTDIDECVQNISRCDQKCENVLGGYKCVCENGFKLSSDAVTCIDIDECYDFPDDSCTKDNELCLNTEGSFRCYCSEGYSYKNGSCTDIDECLNGTSKCQQKCSNIPGSYLCSCNVGYELHANGYFCKDVDECLTNLNQCQQKCYNIPGSYNCSCINGYKLKQNGYSCEDIDECAVNKSVCQQNCTNTPGRFICSCDNGYELQQGGHSCKDIDECLNGETKCEQNCSNIPGSYLCSCNDGYELHTNGYSCKEIEMKDIIVLTVQDVTLSMWKSDIEKVFKQAVASLMNTYCSTNKEECEMTERKRRSRTNGSSLVTASEIIILEGYPKKKGDGIEVAFYIRKQSSGQSSENPFVPGHVIINVLQSSKTTISQRYHISISDVTTLKDNNVKSDDIFGRFKKWTYMVIAIAIGGSMGFCFLCGIIFKCTHYRIHSIREKKSELMMHGLGPEDRKLDSDNFGFVEDKI